MKNINWGANFNLLYARYYSKYLVDGKEYNQTLNEFKYSNIINPNNSISIGNTCSSGVTFSIFKPEITLENKDITIFEGVKGDSGIEYVQIGIESENRKRLLKINPKLNDRSGIYFLLREDENGFKFAYVGQAKSVLQRLASHLVGYEQHIDLSLRKHKLYSEDNPYGWRVEFINFPESQLDEKEKYYIKLYADKGYQLRNVSIGGQGGNRDSGSIGERKAPKGYLQGVQQGKKVLARELSNIAEKHLKIELREDKANNKVSQKQYEKFMELLKVGESE